MTADVMGRELLETTKVGRGLVHRYRWAIGDKSGVADAYERTEPASREVLEDRWEALVGAGEASELLVALYGALGDLAEGLTHLDGETDVIVDGEQLLADTVMDIDGLVAGPIRAWFLERAAKIAR